MNHFRVVCIDDTNRPNDIPTSRWIKRGQEYTVTQVAKLLVQGGILGFKLAEVNIDEFFPYQFFAASRFGILLGPGQLWAEQELDRLLKEVKRETIEINEPL